MTNNNKVNFSNRISILDLTRVLAMLTMIQGHTLDALANPQQLDVSYFPWNLWSFLRGFTAQIFLIVSGAVQMFANKRNPDGSMPPKTIFRRVRMGLLLIIIGYMFLFPADKISNLVYLDRQAWQPFFQVNILHLIGFSLILIITLFTFIKNDRTLGWTAFIIAMLITLLSPFNSNFNWFDYLPEWVGAYLSFSHGSIFPVLPYSAFMLYGVAIGAVIKSRTPSQRDDYIGNWSAPFGIAVILIGLLFFELFREYPILPELILKVNPGMIFVQIGVVLLVIALAALIYSQTEKLAPYYAVFGKKALFIYVSHLILLYGIPWIPGPAKTYFRHLSIWQSSVVALAVIIICLAIAWIYDRSVSKHPVLRKVYIYGIIAFILIFITLGNVL